MTDATAVSTQTRRRSSRRARAIAVGVSILVGSVIAEIALRIAGLDFAAPYIDDRHCGARLKPQARFWHLAEGRAFVTINRDGLRDREHEIVKPAGTFRIAVLGDSFAEALQVDREAAFWAVLERELASCPELEGRTVEVINFGVSDYGTTQELQMLRHYVKPYSPDLVLLALLPGNDVRNNSRDLESSRGRPFYDLIDGQLVLDEDFADEPSVKKFREPGWTRFKDTLIRNSRVLAAAYRAKERWKSRGSENVSGSEAGLDDHVFAPPKDDVWRRAWDVTDGVLGLTNDEARRQGARFGVVVLNNAAQVHPDERETRRAAAALGVEDLDYPDRRLAEAARRHGFPILSLTEPMREKARREQVFFHGFANTALGTGHWNEMGHETAGKLIAEWLCRTRMLDGDDGEAP